jgi:AcrR family transcriptional regulator
MVIDEDRSTMPRRRHPALLQRPERLPNRRQRRSAEIREGLFRAALRLFSEKGFTETTVEDITEAADVGKGTFFNYFPSKDHLLISFSDMQVGKLQDAVDGMRESNEPMPVFLRKLSVRMTEEPARAPDVVRAVLLANLSSSSVRNTMREKHARALELMSQLIEFGQKRGEFRRDIAAQDLAQVFRQTLFGTLLIWAVYGDASLPARIETALNVLLTGLAPRGAKNAASGAVAKEGSGR